METTPQPDLGELYDDTRTRLGELLLELNDDQLRTQVPACPGWEVRDVVAHLVAVAEDAVAGRLSGPPDDTTTAAQIARFRDVPLDETLTRWAISAAPFRELVRAHQVWPAVIDIVTHEHDLRGALHRPGARDSGAAIAASHALLHFDPPVAMIVRLDDRLVRLGPPGGETLILDTSAWETLRWRMGRRSRRQLAAMAWSDDPAPVLDALVVFGPSPLDIHE